jgi:hypothetical protein
LLPVIVFRQLWFLILCVLLGVFAPSRADARMAETRTWVFAPEVAETRLETEPQAVGTHQENGLWNYEHAPGCTQAAENAGARTASAWTRAEVNGSRVYQRTDLIDPARVDALGRTNVQRMQQGVAPVGPDGKSMNLHHMLQTADGPLAEMTQTFHQTNHRVIHINPNTTPSGIDRGAFNTWRGDYWKTRATDFIE